MLSVPAGFVIITFIAAVLGIAGTASTAVLAAKILFLVAILLFAAASLVGHRSRRT